jgi:hypothetical protein
MSFTLLGQHKCVYFGPSDNVKAVRWWAERGQIHYEDSRNNSYSTMSVKTFLERLKAISDMLGNGKKVENKDFMRSDEIERHMRFVEEGVQLARQAREQGMPQDPNVRRQKAAEFSKPVFIPSALSKSIFKSK